MGLLKTSQAKIVAKVKNATTLSPSKLLNKRNRIPKLGNMRHINSFSIAVEATTLTKKMTKETI